MSTAPNTAPPPPANNKMMFALAGVIGAVVVVCSGFMVMALVSGYALERGHAYATNRSPMGGMTTKSGTTKTENKDSGDENPGAYEVARRFLIALRSGRYEDAYQLTSSQLQSDETQSDFRARMSKLSAFRGHTSSSLQQPTNRVVSGKVTIHGYVSGPNGQTRFSMEISQEDDGSWKVDSFGNN